MDRLDEPINEICPVCDGTGVDPNISDNCRYCINSCGYVTKLQLKQDNEENKADNNRD